MKCRTLFLASSVLLLSACGHDAEAPWTSANIEETMRAGELVRDEIRRYREQNGALPESLRDVQRWRGSSLPAPSVGRRRWQYRLLAPPYEFSLATETEHQSPSLFLVGNASAWGRE